MSVTTPAPAPHREWAIEDCRDTFATLRVSPTRADVLVNGSIVSTDDTVNAFSMLLALGGDAPDWLGPLVAARRTLDDVARHTPDLPVPDLTRALRCLTKASPARRDMARHAHTSSVVAIWRLVALSHDHDIQVRMDVARAVPVAGTIALEVAARLAQDEAAVARTLAARAVARKHDGLVELLSRHPSAVVRETLTR